jgi:hypothetical protein
MLVAEARDVTADLLGTCRDVFSISCRQFMGPQTRFCSLATRISSQALDAWLLDRPE